MNDYNKLILDALYNNEIISDELYEKCSSPEYIQSLPYDNRTSDYDKLKERKEELERRLKETNPNLVHSLANVMRAVENTAKQLKDVNNGVKNVRKYDKKIDEHLKNRINYYKDQYEKTGEEHNKKYLDRCNTFKKEWDKYKKLEKTLLTDIKKFYDSQGSKEFKDTNMNKFIELRKELNEIQKGVPMLFYSGKGNSDFTNWSSAHYQIQKGISNSRDAYLNEKQVIEEETNRLDKERNDYKIELDKVNDKIKKVQQNQS